MLTDVAAQLHWAEPLMRSYGYLGVAATVALETLGLPLPGETLLIAAAVLSGRHMLDPAVVAVSAWTGALLGDNAAYLIGRYGGMRLLRRFGGRLGLSSKRLAAGQRIHRRYGAMIVVGARFIPIIRQLNGLLAGSLAMQWWRFVLFDAIGTGLWAGGWVLVGNFAGEEVSKLVQVPPLWWLAGLGAAAAIGGAVLIVLRRRRRVTAAAALSRQERKAA
jgi:membrane protein DedA with SNARE-associated domain